MRKIILNLLNKSMDWLKRKHDLLQKPEQDAGLGAVYCSLSPIDNADEDKHYTKALSWALNTRKENDIRNIALTGPYGSGKSSVLKTFQKNYTGNDFHFLNISLATFKEEVPKIKNEKPDQPKTEDEDSDQPNPLHTADKRRKHANTDDTLRLIELSILQQIFYHAHDDEIPDSRFKKIKGLPKWTALNRTIGVALFVVSLLILFHEHLPSYIRDAVGNQFSGFWIYIAVVLLITGLSYFFLFNIDKSNKKFRFKTPLGLLGLNALLLIYIVGAELDSHDTIQSLIGWDQREFGNLLATLSVVYAISFLLYSIYRIVKYVSRVSINKLKFQDAEIEIDGKVNKSILNHHLDEIIYFFEVTPYNVVIIEDLDRFQQTEIFTKLREINLLLNNSKKTKHKEIVFVYAVRDDMFTDKERTKFFDFIIPIIPVINSSNSSQKLLEKTTLHGYGWSEDLIDSLALFVDDMRLLHNITNEFHLYKNKLTGKLIPDKLLAILIYKNIFPNDFSQLNDNRGVLYDLINRKKKLIDGKIHDIDSEIAGKGTTITELEKLKIKDVNELRLLYISTYLGYMENFVSFKVNSSSHRIKDMCKEELFEYIVNDNAKYSYLSHHYNNNYNKLDNQPLPKTFKEVEKEVDDKHSYAERLSQITDWNSEKTKTLRQEIQELEQKKTFVRKSRIRDILSKQALNKIKNLKQRNLMRVLLSNGYIDEDYFDYISIFYPGSITKSDHEFLVCVKSQVRSKYTHKLNKIDKLIPKINIFNFETVFILNNDLVDFLLTNPSFEQQIEYIFRKLKDESNDSIEFIDNFLNVGQNQTTFLTKLCGVWPGMWHFIETRDDYPLEKKRDYFKRIIEAATIDDIAELAQHSKLKREIEHDISFLSIISDTKKIQDIIENLEISFDDLDFEESPEGLLQFVYENWHYKLNTLIVTKIIKRFGKFNQITFDISNYAAIQNSQCDQLIDYIHNYINEYIEGIYLEIESNINEREPAFIKLLNHGNLSIENKTAIIEKVETKITDLSQTEDGKLKLVLLGADKVMPTWANMLTAYQNDEPIPDEAISFLNIIDNAQELSKTKIPEKVDGKNIYGKFWRELLLTNEISDESYDWITKSSRWWYEDLAIETLSERKVILLIQNNVIKPTLKSFKSLKEHYSDLVILILEKHTSKYIELLPELDLDSDDLNAVLKSIQINNTTKSAFLNSINGDVVTSNDGNLALIAEIVLEDFNFKIDDSLKQVLPFHTKFPTETRIRLFNYYWRLIDNNKTEQFIDSLGGDYPTINDTSKRARIDNNQYNKVFLERLQSKNYISSFTERKEYLRVNHKRK